VGDAVVVVWDGTGVHDDVLSQAQAKGIPVRVLGAVEKRGVPVEPSEPPRGLPD
jgi:hypothetical protein